MIFGVCCPPGLFVGAAAGLAFQNTITVSGIIISALVGLGTIVTLVFGVRWQVVAKVERKAREGEQALNAALEDRIRTLAHERTDLAEKLAEATTAIRDAEKTIARLEALPNLERVLELVSDTFTRLGGRLEELQSEGQKAAEARTGRILDAIGQRAA